MQKLTNEVGIGLRPLTHAINLPASLAPAQNRLANRLEPERSQDRVLALARFLRGRRSALLLPGMLRRLKSACTQVHGVDIHWATRHGSRPFVAGGSTPWLSAVDACD